MTPAYRRKFAPTITLILAVCILLAGCGPIVQPSIGELSGANLFVRTGSYQMEISVTAQVGDIGMTYGSTVLVADTAADWDGTAKVTFADYLFTQNCKTLCQDGTSCKEWRGNWAQSSTFSPSQQLDLWLQMMRLGVCYYPDETCVPADCSDSLSAVTSKTFSVELTNTEILWDALCDADLDTMFGADTFLDTFHYGDVTLYFDAESYLLIAASIHDEQEGSSLDAGIIFTQTDVPPEVDLASLEIIEAPLSEEWSMTELQEAANATA